MRSKEERGLQELLAKWSYAPNPSGVDNRSANSIGRRLYDWWMKFARLLGKVNTVVLLTLVYVVVVGPVALVFRVLGKDLLDRRTEKGESYWYERETDDQTMNRSKRQF